MFAWLGVVAETYDADVVEPRRVGLLLRAGQRKSGIGFQPVIARNTGWKPVPLVFRSVPRWFEHATQANSNGAADSR